ncbi:ribonuclease P protein subunit [Candidatus Micrarchaeota archaeon]|nr:ribonuclease P protein subunit [Candidatus Micrarchaeota archaeon]
MSTKLSDIQVLLGELMGRRVWVVRSTSRELIGLHGTVVNETMNMLVIDCDGGEKTVPKKGNRFEFDGTIVDGEELMFRPEDRIKKNWKRMDSIMKRKGR